MARVRRLTEHARALSGDGVEQGVEVANGHGTVHELTEREREVLSLLATGLDQDAVAERLVISPSTVATHIQRILAKLGVRSRAQAVAVAYPDRIIETDPAAMS